MVIPHLDLIAAAALTILEADTSAYHRRFLRERRDLYEPGTRLMLEVGELIPATHYLQAQRARTIIRDGIRGVFETHHLQALATPTSPLTAVRLSHLSVALSEGDEEATVAAYARNCLPANLTGQPAITVPCGFSSHGLPIGLQLVGRPLAESDIFALAHAYEQATDWHTRTPPIV